MIAVLLASLALCWAAPGVAQEPVALEEREDSLLLIAVGEIPLVLTAPHGGSHFPEAWPVRTEGVRVRDTNTYQVATALCEAIRRRVGATPFLVASRVHRRHLDLNRDEEESGAGIGRDQLRLWEDYHEAIETASQIAMRKGGGSALVIDLHGHGHDHGLIELGFAISADELRRKPMSLADEDWIRGPKSLGARLDALGWKSVPSPARPAPQVGQAYFNGGYTIRRHRGGGLRSIQIELPPHPRRLGAEGRQPLVEGLADAILGLLASEFAIPPIPLIPRSTKNGSIWLPGEDPWSASTKVGLIRVSKELPQYIDVYGVPVLAATDVSAEALQSCAQALVQKLDRNRDRLLDDGEAWNRLRKRGFALVLYERDKPILVDTAPLRQVEQVAVGAFDAWLENHVIQEDR